MFAVIRCARPSLVEGARGSVPHAKGIDEFRRLLGEGVTVMGSHINPLRAFDAAQSLAEARDILYPDAMHVYAIVGPISHLVT